MLNTCAVRSLFLFLPMEKSKHFKKFFIINVTFCCLFNFRIKLSNVVIQKSNVSLLAEHGLRITADKASGNIGAEWHYKESSWFVMKQCYYL